ncbi:MAG: CehA/McbA family metallohydrolase [Myxococcota bacterium]
MISRLGLGMLIAGVAIGTVHDRAPELAPRQRGPYWMLDGDFHVHTRFSDGFLFPIDAVLEARRRGLEVVAITEHNTAWAGKLAAAFGPYESGPIVLPGEEVTTRDYHLIAVGMQRTVPGGLRIEEALRQVHAQGAVAIAAHPVRMYWDTYRPVLKELDGAEVLHPLVRGKRIAPIGWNPEDLRSFWGELSAARTHPLAIGSSDYHFLSALGACRTLVFARERTPESVLEALRAGRTVVVLEDGSRVGDPEMVALMQPEDAPRSSDEDYGASGIWDQLGRWLGFIGLLMLGFGARRADRGPPESASPALSA